MNMMRRAVLAVLAIGALALVSTNPNAQGADDIIKRCQALLTSPEAGKRAEGVEGIVAANNKKAAELACKTIAVERDAEAQVRMGEAFAQFNSEEALAECKEQISKFTKPEQIFGAYYALTGLGKGKTAGGDAALRACLLESKPKDFNLKAAALEAIGESGRRELAPALAELFATWNPDWDDKGVIVALSGIFAAPKLVNPQEKEPRDSVMRGLINILKNAKNDRLRYFSVKALADITGEKMYSEPKFWEWWIEVGGYKTQKDRPEGQTEAARKVPRFFEVATVGKRVVFCIDVSGSMSLPVTMPPAPKKEKPPEPKKEGPVTGGGKSKPGEGDKKKEEPEPDPPDYSKVKIKLDLAIVELVYALKQLDKEFLFNVVIYDTPHQLLIPSVKNLVPATPDNKARFIKAVEALTPRALTNIHGGLMDSFSITDSQFYDWKKVDPAWDPDCLCKGAETIFFLTDGAPTISDDSTDYGEVGRPDKNGRIKPVGNGKMCVPENIVAEIKRVNTFRKCVIHTVGIGPHDSRLMGELARISGGTYTDRTGVAKQ